MVSTADQALYYFDSSPSGVPTLLEMAQEPGTSLQYAIQTNGLTGASSHVSGFGINSPSDPAWGAPYAVALQYGTATREAKHIVGTDVARLYTRQATSGDSGWAYTWQIEHDLSGIGVRYSTFALWTYEGPYLSGYKSGNPLYWGAFSFGSPTDASEAASMASKSYTGLAGGVISYATWDSAMSYYGAVNASYDATSQSVTVTLQLTESHTLYYEQPLGMMPRIDEFDSESPPGGATSAATITCQAPVTNGTFSCGDATGAGAIFGKLYGPNGDEVAGTFSHYLYVSSGYDGVIGGFAAKAATSAGAAYAGPARRTVR